MCRRAGGAFSDEMPSLDRALPLLRRLNKQGASPRRNSIGEPNPGSGDGLLKRDVVCVVSFVTVFKEQSSRDRSEGAVF